MVVHDPFADPPRSFDPETSGSRGSMTPRPTQLAPIGRDGVGAGVLRSDQPPGQRPHGHHRRPGDCPAPKRSSNYEPSTATATSPNTGTTTSTKNNNASTGPATPIPSSRTIRIGGVRTHEEPSPSPRQSRTSIFSEPSAGEGKSRRRTRVFPDLTPRPRRHSRKVDTHPAHPPQERHPSCPASATSSPSLPPW